MIVKLERTQSNTYQNKDVHRPLPHKHYEVHKTMTQQYMIVKYKSWSLKNWNERQISSSYIMFLQLFAFTHV